MITCMFRKPRGCIMKCSAWPRERLIMEQLNYPVPFARSWGTLSGSHQAAAYAEGREMERDMNAYSQDVWNSVDLTALFILVGGILVRVFDSSSPWGRGLYAMSAPLLFSRILFFAQMLRFQGPMIQASRVHFRLPQSGGYMLLIGSLCLACWSKFTCQNIIIPMVFRRL